MYLWRAPWYIFVCISLTLKFLYFYLEFSSIQYIEQGFVRTRMSFITKKHHFHSNNETVFLKNLVQEVGNL